MFLARHMWVIDIATRFCCCCYKTIHRDWSIIPSRLCNLVVPPVACSSRRNCLSKYLILWRAAAIFHIHNIPHNCMRMQTILDGHTHTPIQNDTHGWHKWNGYKSQVSVAKRAVFTIAPPIRCLLAAAAFKILSSFLGNVQILGCKNGVIWAAETRLQDMEPVGLFYFVHARRKNSFTSFSFMHSLRRSERIWGFLRGNSIKIICFRILLLNIFHLIILSLSLNAHWTAWNV